MQHRPGAHEYHQETGPEYVDRASKVRLPDEANGYMVKLEGNGCVNVQRHCKCRELDTRSGDMVLQLV